MMTDNPNALRKQINELKRKHKKVVEAFFTVGKSVIAPLRYDRYVECDGKSFPCSCKVDTKAPGMHWMGMKTAKVKGTIVGLPGCTYPFSAYVIRIDEDIDDDYPHHFAHKGDNHRVLGTRRDHWYVTATLGQLERLNK